MNIYIILYCAVNLLDFKHSTANCRVGQNGLTKLIFHSFESILLKVYKRLKIYLPLYSSEKLPPKRVKKTSKSVISTHYLLAINRYWGID